VLIFFELQQKPLKEINVIFHLNDNLCQTLSFKYFIKNYFTYYVFSIFLDSKKYYNEPCIKIFKHQIILRTCDFDD